MLNIYFATLYRHCHRPRLASMIHSAKNLSMLVDSLITLFMNTRHAHFIGVKRTAPGADNIPYWVCKHCAVELACVIANLLNKTLSIGRLPSSSKMLWSHPYRKFPRYKEFLANVNVLRYVCYMLWAVRLSSVCLSVVCDVGAPYSGGWTIRQFFFTIW